MRSRITAVPAPTNQRTQIMQIARVALVLVASIASACVRTASSATSEDESTAVPIAAQAVAVSTRAWSTTASGIVHANTTVDVAFEVAGKVANVGPDEGQPVRAGETIAVPLAQP